ANAYHLQFASDSAFSSLFVDTSGLNSTVFLLVNLQPDTLFLARLSSQYRGANISSVRAFSTVALPPSAPLVASPVDGSLDQSLGITLAWSPVAGAISYRVQFGTDDTFTTLLVDSTGIDSTTALLNGLTRSTTYYWRVNAVNAGGSSIYSDITSFTTIPSAPGTPVLVSPQDNVSGVPTNATLTWTASSGAASYRVQVSTDIGFGTLLMDQSGIATPSVAVPPLGNNLVYYWRVSAVNAGGMSPFSSIRKFTTIVAPPSTPQLLTPGTGAINQSVNPVLSWLPAPGADFYQLQVSTDDSFLSTVINQGGLVSTSYSATGLLPSTKHFWRVNATNSGGVSSFSPVFNFTTVPAVPAIPLLLSPVDGALNQPGGIRFQWAAVTGATFYSLQISGDTTFVTLTAGLDSTATTTDSVSGLEPSTLYFWRVRGGNAGGASAYSAPFAFTTAQPPPAAPQLIAPLDGATNLPTTFTLSWDSTASAGSYRVQVATDSAFTALVFDGDSVTGTTQEVHDLTNGAMYFWRIAGRNSGGVGLFSSLRMFTTIPNPPTAPTLISPDDGGLNQPTTLTLAWNPVAGSMIYQIQVGTDSSFASLWIDMDSVGTASVEVNGLSLGTRYFWRVRGVNSGGVGPFSESWSFRTIFTTGIEVIGEGVPRVLALHQNFPNPFNPATRSGFRYPKMDR
ncbi:MAG: fibronectin type III domain-containing protein, partial [Bacteroidota bacterium]